MKMKSRSKLLFICFQLGETPIHTASKDGSLPMAEILHCAGCNVDITNKVGGKGDKFACMSGRGTRALPMTEILHCTGCNVDISSKVGEVKIGEWVDYTSRGSWEQHCARCNVKITNNF